MDFGLKEIGITFMVGAFTILGVELVLFHLCGLTITGFFRERLGFVKVEKQSQDESVYTMRLAVFIGLAFGVGILAEDISYKFVDTKLPFGLPSRYDSRITVLIGNLKNPEIENLALDLANNNAFEMLNNADDIKTKDWILSKPTENPCKDNEKDCFVTNSIENLYYFAKNSVYKEANYYDEMKKIQSRADFTRSIAVISFSYLLFTIALGLILIIDKFILENSLIGYLKNTKNVYLLPLRPIIISKLIITLLILLLTFFFASWAFYKETQEFNKRAFGYFSSMLQKEKNSARKSEPGKTQFIIEGVPVTQDAQR